MEALQKFEQVLARLERLSKRLQSAARADRAASNDKTQDARRSLAKGTALHRRLCVAYDFHFRAAWAQRFLNTVAQFNASTNADQRTLAGRGLAVVNDMLFRSEWRGAGRRPERRSVPPSNQTNALRLALLPHIQRLWREEKDLLDRGTKLRKLLNELGVACNALPIAVLKRPASRVFEFVVSQHFGAWQTDARRRPSATVVVLHR